MGKQSIIGLLMLRHPKYVSPTKFYFVWMVDVLWNSLKLSYIMIIGLYDFTVLYSYVWFGKSFSDVYLDHKIEYLNYL